MFYKMLPVSVVFHAAVIGGIIVAATWNVNFPQASPKLYLAFHLDAAPTPPPPPPPPPASRPRQPAPDVRPPDEIVAPTVIPDVIPFVENEQTLSTVQSAGGIEGGVEGGIVGGVIGGVLESVLADVLPPPPLSDGRIHVARDEPLQIPVLSKIYPIYPSNAVRRRWEDTLVVRYVIGKDGRVIEVKVVQPPSRNEFERPTLEAIRTWRFRPYLENGEAKEVVHELTVYYKLVPRSAGVL